MGENERRRQSAHDMWLQQLTPEERGQYELDHAGEVVEANPAVLEASRGLSVDRAVLDEAELVAEAEAGYDPAKLRPRRLLDEPYGCEEGFGLLWVPGEPREALQRAIERRD